MPTYDVKKERRDLYAPPRDPVVVQVPPLEFLVVDGHGDPNSSPAYREAVQALYTVSYAVRAVAKARLGRVHTVGPLQGLWSADDLDVFRTRDKGAWDWTMMIVQPGWVTADLVEEALSAARHKRLPALELLRFQRYDEGLSVQVLHVRAYDDEGPVLERLHHGFLPARGLTPTGRHHEIYLSDPRRSAPARLRTVLRQPVAAQQVAGPVPGQVPAATSSQNATAARS